MFPRTLQLHLIFALALGTSLGATFAHPAVAYDLAGADNGCSQNPREQSQLISEAEANEYAIRRVEFLGNATTRHNVLARRVFLVEGDIFTRKVLERSIRSLSKLKIIKPVQLS